MEPLRQKAVPTEADGLKEEAPVVWECGASLLRCWLFSLARIHEKGRRPKSTPYHAPLAHYYIFFSAHVLVAASHMPPAFLQSASVCRLKPA